MRLVDAIHYASQRNIHINNRDGLKYYHAPDLNNCDLKIGFPEKFIKRAEVNEHIDALLECLDTVPDAHADIITWRGIVNKIMLSPYSVRDSWDMNVTRHNDTIYIEEVKSLKDSYGCSENDQMMSYWGYKFENLATINKAPSTLLHNDPVLQERLDEIVDTNIQYCSVFKTKIGDHRIILGGEVDCIYCDHDASENPQKYYTELKTNRIFTNPRQRENFERFKLLKVWGQSFLAGVSSVIFGFRDDQGHVREIEKFKTLEIPRIVRSKGFWDPNVCLGFVNSVFNFLKASLQKNDASSVYRLQYASNSGKVTLKGPDADAKAFIPEWLAKKQRDATTDIVESDQKNMKL